MENLICTYNNKKYCLPSDNEELYGDIAVDAIDSMIGRLVKCYKTAVTHGLGIDEASSWVFNLVISELEDELNISPGNIDYDLVNEVVVEVTIAALEYKGVYKNE